MKYLMTLAMSICFLAAVAGCPSTPPGGNDNAVGNTNDNGSAGNVNDNTEGNDNEAGEAEVLMATLSSDQENPPLTTGGSGSGTFTLNGDRTLLTFQVSVAGLTATVTGAHLHMAPVGSNGPIMFNFTDLVQQQGDMATASAVWNFSTTTDVISVDDAVTALLADGIYVNFHTTNNPAGEVRGQLNFDDDDE